MKNIYDVSQNELGAWLEHNKQPSFRIDQIWQGLYSNLYDKPAEFSNLPLEIRKNLEQSFYFSPLQPLDTKESQDGKTVKYLFDLFDHNKIETVIMKYDSRNTACISTQAGCSVGCVFCATGQMGFFRNLTAGEIIAQVFFIERILRKQNLSLSNIVIMGMGEPLLNYDATLSAIKIINHPNSMNLGARRFTISTVGIIPGIRQLMQEPIQINLAISLHASDDQIRQQLIPISETYPLCELMKACHTYTQSTHRRITFEWALIENINDSLTMAKQLTRLVKGLLCHVNLIALNPTGFYSQKPTGNEHAKKFQAVLHEAGIPCTIRLRRGIEIKAGCGQLAYKNSPDAACYNPAP